MINIGFSNIKDNCLTEVETNIILLFLEIKTLVRDFNIRAFEKY